MIYKSIVIVEAQGFSGGLWILVVDEYDFSFFIDHITSYLSVSVRVCEGGSEWLCTGVYVSFVPNRRADMCQKNMPIPKVHVFYI